MSHFIGEFEIRLDAKGRLSLPAGVIRQLPSGGGKVVINRGFEPCLVLYSGMEWDRQVAELSRLNPYVKENREFVRYFLRGASPAEPDAANRILIPRALLDYAGIDKDVVMMGNLSNLELWSPDRYKAQLDREPEDFSALAEKVMGGRSV
jgi:MraZ protein